MIFFTNYGSIVIPRFPRLHEIQDHTKLNILPASILPSVVSEKEASFKGYA